MFPYKYFFFFQFIVSFTLCIVFNRVYTTVCSGICIWVYGSILYFLERRALRFNEDLNLSGECCQFVDNLSRICFSQTCLEKYCLFLDSLLESICSIDSIFFCLFVQFCFLSVPVLYMMCLPSQGNLVEYEEWTAHVLNIYSLSSKTVLRQCVYIQNSVF